MPVTLHFFCLSYDCATCGILTSGAHSVHHTSQYLALLIVPNRDGEFRIGDDIALAIEQLFRDLVVRAYSCVLIQHRI